MKSVLGNITEIGENYTMNELRHVDVTDTILDLYDYAKAQTHDIYRMNTKIITDMCGNKIALYYCDDKTLQDMYLCINDRVRQDYPHYMSTKDIHMVANHFFKYSTMKEVNDDKVIEACITSFKKIARLFLGDIEYVTPAKGSIYHTEMSYMAKTRANCIHSLLDKFGMTAIIYEHMHHDDLYYDYLAKTSGSPARLDTVDMLTGKYKLKETINNFTFNNDREDDNRCMRSPRHSTNDTKIPDGCSIRSTSHVIDDMKLDYEEKRLINIISGLNNMVEDSGERIESVMPDSCTSVPDMIITDLDDAGYGFRNITTASNVVNTQKRFADIKLPVEDVDAIYACLPNINKAYRKKKVHHTIITINNDNLFGTNADNEEILFATYNPKKSNIVAEVVCRLVDDIPVGDVTIDVKTDDDLLSALLLDNRLSDIIVQDGKTTKYGAVKKKSHKRGIPNSNGYSNTHKNNRKSVVKYK